jgi:hypothetical protein
MILAIDLKWLDDFFYQNVLNFVQPDVLKDVHYFSNQSLLVAMSYFTAGPFPENYSSLSG